VPKNLALSTNPISLAKPHPPAALPENAATTPVHLKYEIGNEVLARQIFGKMPAEARARRQVEEFIRARYRLAVESGLPDQTMTADELEYIAPYVNAVNLDAAEDAFVKTAQRMLQERKRKQRRLHGVGLGVLGTLAIGFGIFLWYPRHGNEPPDKNVAPLAPSAPPPVPPATTVTSCPDRTSESCAPVGDKKAQPTLETQVLAAKNAQAAAEQSARSDASDRAVLAHFRKVLDDHRSALASIGAIAPLEDRIRALESLVQSGKTADAVADNAGASLAEKRQADLAYVYKAREVRGAGADLTRISKRIEEWNSRLARHVTVLKVVMCLQREGLFCETATQGPSFRTGRPVFATVSLAAKTSHRPVTFKWFRDGNLERQERHTVEHSDARGFRISGEVRPRRPGNWEFCVYDEAGQLITKVPFTVH
jgi:hypothetical protein